MKKLLFLPLLFAGSTAYCLTYSAGASGTSSNTPISASTVTTSAIYSGTPPFIIRTLVAPTTNHFVYQDLNQRFMLGISSNGYTRIAIGTSSVSGNITSVYDVKYASASNVANVQTELFSSTVPGGAFFEEGDSIEFRAYGTFGAGGSANKRIICAFGVGTSSITFDTGNSNATASVWEIEGSITRIGTSSLKSQVGGGQGLTPFTNAIVVLNANSLGNNLFRISGQGSQAADITLDYAIIKVVPGTSP